MGFLGKTHAQGRCNWSRDAADFHGFADDCSGHDGGFDEDSNGQ